MIMKKQGALHDPRYLWTSQMTSASAFVEVSLQFNSSLPVILNFQQSFPFRAQLGWKRVCQAKRHKLYQTRLIPMR